MSGYFLANHTFIYTEVSSIVKLLQLCTVGNDLGNSG